MLYAPHFKLRAFDTLSDEAKIPVLIRLLEALIGVNEAWLRENPHAPSLYTSRVRSRAPWAPSARRATASR